MQTGSSSEHTMTSTTWSVRMALIALSHRAGGRAGGGVQDPNEEFPHHLNNRVITALVYLSDTDDGSGETVFPLAVPPLQVQRQGDNQVL